MRKNRFLCLLLVCLLLLGMGSAYGEENKPASLTVNPYDRLMFPTLSTRVLFFRSRPA